MPFEPGFDLICLFDVLEHLPDDRRVLQDIRTMLSPSGILMLTVPAHMSLWSYFDRASHHCRRYELRQLQAHLLEAGYHIEFSSEYMMALYPLVRLGRRLAALKDAWWSRSSEMIQCPARLAEQELRIVPGLNQLLTWLLIPETLLLRSQCKLPIGTSLLVVARKVSEAKPEACWEFARVFSSQKACG
jgi:SAM-dependent methyltransferase